MNLLWVYQRAFYLYRSSLIEVMSFVLLFLFCQYLIDENFPVVMKQTPIQEMIYNMGLQLLNYWFFFALWFMAFTLSICKCLFATPKFS